MNTDNQFSKQPPWLKTIGLFFGCLLACWLFAGISPGESVRFIYQYFGVTFVALLPLAVWTVDLVVGGGHVQLTLRYVAAQAKELGFVGTLIGICIMLVAISDSLQAGDSEGIRKAMAGFAQAAVSTIAGCGIAVFAKHFDYVAEVEARSGEKQ